MKASRTAPSIDRKLLAISIALLIVSPSAACGQNGAVGIAYPTKGITIDGDLGDWPVGLHKYPIERIEFGDKLHDDKDLKAHFRIAFNQAEHAIYVGVEVQDDSLVLDGAGEPAWNAQDGCELFIDAVHDAAGSPFVQFARYGNQDRTVGPLENPKKMVKVAVARADSTIIYEWRIEVATDLAPNRVIGFDISVADKDKDGSFSWAAWGSGTQKFDTPDRCGEILLVGPETRFGEVTGQVTWANASSSALPPRVRVRSHQTAALWRDVPVDPSGAYKATSLPPGPYSIAPVDSPEVRVEEKSSVDVIVAPDRSVKANALRITPIPWPGLIGDEGVLRGSKAFNPDELDRLVQAYLGYFKIPGISLAVIKDSKIVYNRGLGVRNTKTSEPVTEETVFEAASMTKPVFAYTVMRLVDRGVLKLDTPLYTYLPYEDIAYDERYKLITARMVLTHRTGFPNWRTGKLDLKFVPGSAVSYSGEGFVYLGNVVEKLTGKKLVAICDEEVFVPLGVEHASLVYNDDVARLTAIGHARSTPLSKWKVPEPNMAASLHVSAGNYARFLIAVVQGKGLAEPTAKEMLRSQVKIPDGVNASWGLGIAIEETPHGTQYGHGGRNTGFTSHSRIFKEAGDGYVFLVNNDDAAKMDNVLNAYLIAGKSKGKVTHIKVHRDGRDTQAKRLDDDPKTTK
jgi:CubicO group peptidase (beta-lactamase class C family)